MDPFFLAATALSSLPWLLLLKLKLDLKDLISLEKEGQWIPDDSSKSPQRAQEQCQKLIDLLKKQKELRILERHDENTNWDLEIIIPAFNEEFNITTCVDSLANSALSLHAEYQLRTRIIVVDDNSTDRTPLLVEDCKNRLKTLLSKNQSQPHSAYPLEISLINSKERPKDEVWLGKNWACHTGFQASKADHLLIVDSDVSVKSRFLSSFVRTLPSEYQFSGLLASIVCKSLLDDVVQANTAMLALFNNISKSLSPGTKKPLAFGQCIYITRKAYLATGGYEAANKDSKNTRGLETRALANSMLRTGLPAINLAGGGLIQVYMYHNAKDLWEGWTKNFFIAADQSIPEALIAITIVLLLWDFPLIVLLSPHTAWLALVFFAGHFFIRLLAYRVYKVPLKRWYLFPLGGLAFAIIMIGSAYKVLYGRNLTWKGRSLALTATQNNDRP